MQLLIGEHNWFELKIEYLVLSQHDDHSRNIWLDILPELDAIGYRCYQLLMYCR